MSPFLCTESYFEAAQINGVPGENNEIAPYGFNQVQANLVTSVKSTIPRKVCVIDSKSPH